MCYGDEGEDMRQVQHSKQKSGLDVGKLKGQQGDLLFVGSGDVFNDDLARRVFRGYQLRTISRAMGLSDALKQLESKIVDLVLLGGVNFMKRTRRSLFLLRGAEVSLVSFFVSLRYRATRPTVPQRSPPGNARF